ncbi:MAG: DUF58 domain-containing protein [Holophaga sp.]|jgi:uncharacterized protein (DUF58 family)
MKGDALGLRGDALGLRPGARLLALLGLWLALAVPACLWPGAWRPGWAALGVAAAALALADALAALRLPAPACERRLPPVLPIGAWTPVRLRFANRSGIHRRLRWFDGAPPSMDLRHQPQELVLAPGAWAETSYAVCPRQRGPCVFTPTDVQVASPLRLWWRLLRLGPARSVKVFPNFAPVKKYALLARGHRLEQLGIHRRRRRGEGSEFHQLRDYRPGDSLRQVDWKATARMRRLISRDYQEEQDQQVVCLLDCGRRMRSLDGRLSHFDHTLAALLLLAYVALRQGDAVGLLTFAGPTIWLPPRKTPATLDRLLAAVHDLQPTLRPTDYLDAARAALARIRKRALVVLITNLRDEDDETLGPALQLLRHRHRVILASLREPDLDLARQAPIHEFRQALRAGAIDAYLAQRRQAFTRLAPRGGAALDVLPRQLPVALVNQYLAEKRSGRI